MNNPSIPSSSSQSKNLWKQILLPFVATLNVPPYSMIVWFTIYLVLLLSASSHYYMRTFLVGYWLYCIFETRTAQATQQPTLIRYMQNHLGRLWFVKWTAEYFQTQLIKTTDLPPTSTYIFSYHPHGVISMGASLALTTNGCDFDQVFPGIRRVCATLNVTFWAPIYRHWMLWLGCCSANKATLVGRLNNQESLVLIPGGAVEALHAHPQTFVVAIQNRYGFLRLARETGAKPVPVLGFGENDVFQTIYHGQPTTSTPTSSKTTTSNDPSTAKKDDTCTDESNNKHSMLWKVQHRLYKHLTFSIPLWFHLVPKNEIPLTVVVGAPVEFPDQATLEECHAQYLQAVMDLYETHKDRYGYKHVPLVFV